MVDVSPLETCFNYLLAKFN